MGILNPIIDAITVIINWLYHLTETFNIGNYGLAIILFTIILKIILYPLTLKQMKSMYLMQKLAPQIKEIQNKYKTKDPQKMQQKMMELYKEHNVNPMAGCLPLLIQMPILFALFTALRNFQYVNVEDASFLWIQNLSQINNGPNIGVDLYLMALLAAITTFIQSKLTTSMTDPTQRMMLYIMPIMIAYFATKVPAGLALYWVTFNTLGIIQQYIVNKQTKTLKEAVADGAGNRKKG